MKCSRLDFRLVAFTVSWSSLLATVAAGGDFSWRFTALCLQWPALLRQCVYMYVYVCVLFCVCCCMHMTRRRCVNFQLFASVRQHKEKSAHIHTTISVYVFSTGVVSSWNLNTFIYLYKYVNAHLFTHTRTRICICMCSVPSSGIC